ncbi:VacJ family lipoprotein [Xenophilus arseniciresistens]|uniref:VacJ family lipoprotein n=1 Tax=Xenophilus arseniciresistens TaxID=1283306 RepID=A0AAE3N492_9BURK|nr:VacJ family lipoprotein [Xenophilus arseniciresistens]MDA7415515.1 VacJ family lipoprotein [Xenophilus arseniciresistens]
MTTASSSSFTFPGAAPAAWRLAGTSLALALGLLASHAAVAQPLTGNAQPALPAASAAAAPAPASNEDDPFEPFNRTMYRFNDGLDRAVLKPVATTYRDVLPSFVRTGVSNFFGNIGDVWNLANNVMQLKLRGSAETFMRLNVNTVFGLGGLLDIASEAGINRHSEDFGQTLGYWGVPSGPFVMLPLFGPSTLRDTAALPADRWGNPVGAINDIPVRNALSVLDVVDTRARLLGVTQLLQEAALDPYSFLRDSHLQRRAIEVRDGAAGTETEERYDLD